MKDMLKQGVIRTTIYLDLKSFYHIDIAPGIVRRKYWESQEYKIQGRACRDWGHIWKYTRKYSSQRNRKGSSEKSKKKKDSKL